LIAAYITEMRLPGLVPVVGFAAAPAGAVVVSLLAAGRASSVTAWRPCAPSEG
jgi:hypothetical protein